MNLAGNDAKSYLEFLDCEFLADRDLKNSVLICIN